MSQPMARNSSIIRRLNEFMFPPCADNWLTILRVGLGLELICYAVSLRHDWINLLASTPGAYISRRLSEGLLSMDSWWIPRMSWLVGAGAYIGLTEPNVLVIAWVLLFAAALCLTIGFYSRPAAVVSWFMQLSVAKSTILMSYGVDNLMTIGLFYLMISPLPNRFAVDYIWQSSSPNNPRLLGFFRRVLQIHLCLIYFFAGLSKALGRGWWDGSNLWRALGDSPLNPVMPELLLRGKFFLLFTGIAIVTLELGYCAGIWHRTIGRIWLGCICLMHALIGIIMGMYLFALVMIILNLAAFGPRLPGRLTGRQTGSYKIAKAPMPPAGLTEFG